MLTIKTKELLDHDVIGDAVEDEITDTGRWHTYHSIVFKWKDDKHYTTSYREGSTEMQDESPWEDETEVDCQEVEWKEVKVSKWVVVETDRIAPHD